MNQHRRKPTMITFEADERLFAEFIAYKETVKNKLHLGYISENIIHPDYGEALYKPLRETEVIALYQKVIEGLTNRISRLESDGDKLRWELKQLTEPKDMKIESTKRKRWF